MKPGDLTPSKAGLTPFPTEAELERLPTSDGKPVQAFAAPRGTIVSRLGLAGRALEPDHNGSLRDWMRDWGGDVAKLTAAIEALAGAIRQYDRGSLLDPHERAGNLVVVLVRARELVNRFEGVE